MKTLFSVILTLVLALTSIPVNAQSWGTDSHYLVLRQLADGRILPVSYQRVQMAAPLESLADKDLQQALQLSPLGDHEGYIASLQDAKGDTYYQNIARVPRLLRGEFAATRPEGGIDGYSIPLEETVFVVRVPVLAQTRLVLLDGSKTPLAEFDLDQLASEPSLRPADSASAYTVTPIQVTGSPANRLDMVILGDGYTAAEQSKFLSDTAWVTGGFFNISPLIEYMNYHNIYAIYAPSNQSGADHPLYSAGCTAGDPTCCGDPIMASDPQNGKMVDTIFDSTYCYYNIYRLLVAMDYSAIYTAAAAMPDWDEILLVVNDTTYGGSGGSIAVFSVNSNAVEIAKHEFGHSFGELADEYDYGNPSSCNDLDGNTNNDCASNVTNATSLAQIKWRFWIVNGTPIPTPETAPYNSIVGLFEGAIYNPTGYYRSGFDCLMRNLDRPFCQVPGQTMILNLYQGGWGTPWEGISMIEPGSTAPATDTVNTAVGETVLFNAVILQPTFTPVAIDWLIDDVVQTGWNSGVFTYTAASTGTFEIVLRVNDHTPQVRPEMSSGALTFEHSWTVNVSPPPLLTYLPAILNNGSSKIVQLLFVDLFNP